MNVPFPVAIYPYPDFFESVGRVARRPRLARECRS